MDTSRCTIITVSARQVGTACVLTVAGEIDEATAPTVRGYADTVFDRSPTALVLDFRDVTFCAAVGVRIVDKLRRDALAAGIPFSVVARKGQTLRVLEIARLPGDLRIHACVEDALA